MRPENAAMETTESKSKPSAVGTKGRLLATVIVAAVMVAIFWGAFTLFVQKDTWAHDFLFKRSFVQWVLISAFALGLVHLVGRLPAWWRERRALGQMTNVPEETTMVGRRWVQIQAAVKELGSRDLGVYSKTLAEHDEAELEAEYRLSGDIVQVLPLVGFFGTVFGLSHGLYQSFLATGGTTTKDFAKAIAIAFDNTLLALGLTIILFVIRSILKKREEELLLQLNLQVNDTFSSRAGRSESTQPVEKVIETLKSTLKEQEWALREHGTALDRICRIFESPGEELKEFLRSNIAGAAKTVMQEAAAIQHAQAEELKDSVQTVLMTQANKLLEVVSTRAVALVEASGPLQNGVSDVKKSLTDLNTVAAGISSQLNGFAKELASIQGAQEKLDVVMGDVTKMSESIAGFGAKLDAVPEERRRIEDLAAAIKELAAALAQRDSVMLTNLQGALNTHSREIRNEIRQPRTIKFVEATQFPVSDGESRQG